MSLGDKRLRGLVKVQRRQELARALAAAAGPLTTGELAQAIERPAGLAHYHLRALSVVDAVTPSREARAGKRVVSWSLTADNLPTWAREILLGAQRGLGQEEEKGRGGG